MENRQVTLRKIAVHSVDRAGFIVAYKCPTEGLLYRMEKEMSKRFGYNSSARGRHAESISEFIDELVAVNYTSKGTSWCRGFILNKKRVKSDLRLKVHLIDYCSNDDFPPEDVRPLPSEFNTSVLESQSMQIVLYGILPAFLELDLCGNNKLTGNTEFCDKDVTFIKKQLEDARSIHFEEKCRVEEFYFGDIMLEQNDGSMLNLKNLLLQSLNAIEVPDFENYIPEYIKNFRRCSSAFNYSLAMRKILFPSISFSDVDRSTDNSDTIYYRSPPVDIETPKGDKNTVLRRSYSNDLSNVSLSKATMPATAALSVTDEFLDESSNLIDKVLVVTGDPTNHFRPINSFMESSLDPETFHMINRLELRDLSRCQKYLVPAILTGKNVTIIDKPDAGKTVGVLIPLVSLMRKSSKEKTGGLGARAIVVCPYSAKCEQVQNSCLQLIHGRRRVTNVSSDPVSVYVSYGLGTELELKNMKELLKGYDILACTPRRLLRLLQHENTFDFSRLSLIVFDDMSTLLKCYGNEIEEILVHVKRKRKPPQRIIISDHWMPELKPFVKEDVERKRGSLLISSYLDAAVFVRLKTSWHCTSDEKNKVIKITEMLNGVLESRNVLVVFSDEDDIDSVYDRIRFDTPRQIYKIQDLERMYTGDIVKDWQKDVVRKNYPVLFCTDYVLRNIQIYEADYLIHYSLPQSKNNFLFRFSVLLNRLQNVADEIIKSPQRPMHPLRRPETCIFSNQENDLQFPDLVKIMQRLGAEIPDTIRMKAILRNKEMLKKESGLCPNLKEFGRCHRESRCIFRHIVLQDDSPDKTLPLNGYIKAHVKYVYSATHYGIRILGHATESAGPWLPVKGLPGPGLITLKLSRHFFDKQNRKTRAHNEVGDIVVFERNDVFYRVKIIKFRRVDVSENDKKPKTPKFALVKFIDEGREDEIPTASLMELPESLASIPPEIIDVFICNLLPIDGDVVWGNQITRIVEDKLTSLRSNDTYDNCYLVGKVELVLGRTLWLDSLTLMEKNPAFESPIPRLSMSKMLEKQKLAIRHEEHLPFLRRICQDAGFENIDSSASSSCPEENALDGHVFPEKIHSPASNAGPEKDASDKNVDDGLNIPSSSSISSAKNEDEGPGKPHPSIKINSPEKNALDRNINVHNVPSNCDITSTKLKGAESEKPHPPASINRPEKDALDKNINARDVPFNHKISSTIHKGAGFEKTHPPASISRPENKSSDKIVNNDHLSVIASSVSNQNHVFKEPNAVEPKRNDEKNSVSPNALKPYVDWRQDLTHVFLTVNVNSDPNNFKVDVTTERSIKLHRKDRLYFWALMDQKVYEFSELLYYNVHVSSVQSYKSGASICIKMRKMIKRKKWEKLFRMRVPYKWVRIDQNFIDSSDEELNTKAHKPIPYLRRKIRRDEVREVDIDSGSNSDSADDHDNGYFED